MPKISAKRQITLPIDQCKVADLNPGDKYESYADNSGSITIVKLIPGAAKSMLKNVSVNNNVSEEESRSDGMSDS